jgi:hypothetical protein
VTELIIENFGLPSSIGSRSEVAQAVARKFLAATSATECLEFVSEASQWEAAIKRHVLMKPLKPLPVMSTSVDETDSTANDKVTVKAMLLGNNEIELPMVWKSGRALVDWPSFVGWSSMEWAEVMKRAPQEALNLRVLAEMVENYTNDFSDVDSLLCVKLSDPMQPASPPLYAYAQRDTAEAKGLASLLKHQRRSTKLTLAIRYPANPKSRDQVWIDKVVSLNWLYPASADNAHAASTAR